MTDGDVWKSRLQALQKEGWSKQFIAGEPRLSEAVDMYRQAGFEVHLEPLPESPQCSPCGEPSEGQECRVCYNGFADQYKVIFTRRNVIFEDHLVEELS
jgi:hypothetical protein